MVTISGLISSISMSFSMNMRYRFLISATHCLTWPPVRPRAKATRRPWKSDSPEAGSTLKLTIFSGVEAATSSMSMPPSVEATKLMREVPRSTSSARYSSRSMSLPSSM